MPPDELPETQPGPGDGADFPGSPDSPRSAAERAASLISVFFADPGRFGSVREVDREAVPRPVRQLLDHHGHMTVTMEAFFGGPVTLRVLRESRAHPGSNGRYVREIVLAEGSGRPVQYGIVRLDLSAVPVEARRRIEAGSAPLGRILIEAAAFRDVHDVRLVEVVAGPDLAERISIARGRMLHGRVATISLAPRSERSASTPEVGEPAASAQAPRTAIELLEIPLLD